jgi:hypothetical protein
VKRSNIEVTDRREMFYANELEIFTFFCSTTLYFCITDLCRWLAVGARKNPVNFIVKRSEVMLKQTERRDMVVQL